MCLIISTQEGDLGATVVSLLKISVQQCQKW